VKLELDTPIVLRVVDGIASYDLIHLPAPEKVVRERVPGKPGGGRHVIALATQEETGFGLARWPTLCGLDGLVFAYGGSIRRAVRDPRERAHLCGVCMARAAVTSFPVEMPSQSSRHSKGARPADPVPVTLVVAAERRCKGCECRLDDETRGCRNCYARHYQRRAAQDAATRDRGAAPAPQRLAA
jgi:hypothetical protein